MQLFDDPELDMLVQACWEWHSAFEQRQPARWLSLLGNSGTGKTHCAKWLWRSSKSRIKTARTVERGGYNYHEDIAYTPREIYWPDFVQELRAQRAYDLRDDMKQWPVLFLDDIGAERDATGFAAEELNTLLGCRMNKWTLLTSNKTPEALKAVDGRIYSRLIRDRNISICVNTKDFSDR